MFIDLEAEGTSEELGLNPNPPIDLVRTGVKPPKSP